MLFSELRRFAAWLTRASTSVDRDETSASASSVFEFDPMWHGDHWQNLLSSPMDARRYVMEDWSVSPAFSWDEAERTASAH
ncbi:hypothetical protein AAGS40_11195 [Paraburkholderia sp. PREW-6R]|uniref:hypothetical protein n=1 Tax=Paraburkholderia sp. PREW-6R TaxID=3141544 RepID=UPI0031F4EC43